MEAALFRWNTTQTVRKSENELVSQQMSIISGSHLLSYLLVLTKKNKKEKEKNWYFCDCHSLSACNF